MVRGIALCLLAFVAAGCGQDEPPVDLRFHTPQATVDTLFEAYGVMDISQEEVRRRMDERGRFHLHDPATYQLCFSDYGGPQDEGLAGFVFGSLAAAKDELRITMTQEEARVFPNPDISSGRAVLLRRQPDGAWKIVLRQSVPREIQNQLYGVYHRAQQQAARAGRPVTL